jgi:hypothetical protein
MSRVRVLSLLGRDAAGRRPRPGLLGHLVREHGIGLAVDCRDPCALREAILELAGERADTRRYEDAVARFAARFSQERFEAAVIAPFHKRL